MIRSPEPPALVSLRILKARRPLAAMPELWGKGKLMDKGADMHRKGITGLGPLCLMFLLAAGTALAQKTVYLYNPWPENAPMAKLGNAAQFTNMIMSKDKARCGWYSAAFTAAPHTALFKSIFGAETYGATGMGSGQPIDLAASFIGRDTVFLVPNGCPDGSPGIGNFQGHRIRVAEKFPRPLMENVSTL
jgi:hypothetical protein